jgi:uncharacterized membrane protein
MPILVAGLVVFLGLHLLPTVPEARAGIRDRVGHNAYQLVYSVLSLVGLILIIKGFGDLRGTRADIQLWTPPAFGRHITMLLMWPAFILLAAAYIPSRIRTAAKHPMLAAIKLWAFAHLLVRGDLAGVLLFGSFLAYGVYDRISVKKRAALGPLGTAKGGLRGDVAAVAVGTVAYGLMVLWGHAYLIGVPLS